VKFKEQGTMSKEQLSGSNEQGTRNNEKKIGKMSIWKK